MAAPRAPMPFLDHPGPIPFAHRGGTEAGPENTLVAFEAAVRLGYRYLETDVHLTGDGRLIAFHDEELDRVTDRSGRVDELPWREVAAARVGGTQPIPLFEEVLAAFPDARVNVEPKSDAATDELAEAIRRAGAVDRVLVASFVERRVARARALLGPRLCTGLGNRGTVRLLAAARGLGRPRFAARAAQVPISSRGVRLVTERNVRTAHRLGLAVHVWTVDDPATMHELLDLGVDGIMTDRPSVLKAVLLERGQWSG